MPWFDPADGGVDARILWLLEAPGPRSTEQCGSGIISCDNNDGAAENTWRTRREAGVDRRHVVHWNVIPYYIGDETKVRAWLQGDVAHAGPLLKELVDLLPHLRAVILGGKAAQEGWRGHRPQGTTLRDFACPHPSVTNVRGLARRGLRVERRCSMGHQVVGCRWQRVAGASLLGDLRWRDGS